jgi:hypothetical protein
MKHGLPLIPALSPYRGERSPLPHAEEGTGERAG